MAHLGRERFRVLFLDSRNVLIADEAMSDGTVNQTSVYVREVIHRALDLGATALILVHNHPSGDPKPSRDDIQLTNHVRDAARVLGIQLHDHIVIGREGHASFKALGLL
jgi:DNA repair protein RadC